MILQTTMSWADYPLNRWLVIASVLILLACINNFISLMPYLAKALVEWKANIRLEASMPRVRSRNTICMCLMLPFCLIAGRYGLVDMDVFSFCPENLKILTVAGTLAAYFLLRETACLVCRPRKGESAAYKSAKSCERNYFILIVFLLLATTGAMTIFKADDQTIRQVLLVELGVLYLFTLVMKSQILSSSCNPFSTFLYLCALEIIPTGILIFTVLRF